MVNFLNFFSCRKSLRKIFDFIKIQFLNSPAYWGAHKFWALLLRISGAKRTFNLGFYWIALYSPCLLWNKRFSDMVIQKNSDHLFEKIFEPNRPYKKNDCRSLKNKILALDVLRGQCVLCIHNVISNIYLDALWIFSLRKFVIKIYVL